MDINLHSLPGIVDKRAKIKGRGIGSGAGVKSGRGTTRHQSARTTIPLHFEGGQNRMVKKFPLLRGKDRNPSYTMEPIVINVEKLNRFSANDVIDVDALVKARMVDDKAYEVGVKILAQGKLEKALQVALPMSKTAREKIEKAGGKVIEA
jgi:ribosomal protein L15